MRQLVADDSGGHDAADGDRRAGQELPAAELARRTGVSEPPGLVLERRSVVVISPSSSSSGGRVAVIGASSSAHSERLGGPQDVAGGVKGLDLEAPAPPETGIDVSNPVRVWVATDCVAPPAVTASTLHELTCVAPFQLA